jgi:predicted transcriptional regulator
MKKYIRDVGVSEVSRRTKISLRTLHYLLSGDYKPSYRTWQKLVKEIEGN